MSVRPRRTPKLQERIIREHLCISQFPPGAPVQRKHFPIRNRTMALLSDATVIMEATDRSGALTQGWEVLRLGRDLFMAKAISDDPSLLWPAKMVYYGGQVLSDDTLEGFLDGLPQRSEADRRSALPF